MDTEDGLWKSFWNGNPSCYDFREVLHGYQIVLENSPDHQIRAAKELLAKYPDDHYGLALIIAHVPDEDCKNKAWDILLASSKDNLVDKDILFLIMEWEPESFQHKAWVNFCARSPGIRDLFYGILHIREGQYKTKAIDMLFAQNPTREDFVGLFNELDSMPQEFQDRFRQYFRTREPSMFRSFLKKFGL